MQSGAGEMILCRYMCDQGVGRILLFSQLLKLMKARLRLVHVTLPAPSIPFVCTLQVVDSPPHCSCCHHFGIGRRLLFLRSVLSVLPRVRLVPCFGCTSPRQPSIAAKRFTRALRRSPASTKWRRPSCTTGWCFPGPARWLSEAMSMLTVARFTLKYKYFECGLDLIQSDFSNYEHCLLLANTMIS